MMKLIFRKLIAAAAIAGFVHVVRKALAEKEAS